MRKLLQRVSVFIFVGSLMLLAFYIGTSVTASQATQSIAFAPAEQIIATPPPDATGEELALANLYSRISPSVVAINVVSRISGATGFDSEGFAEGGGTGFVLDQQGHIVTNAHVVDGAVLIEINFIDGTIVRGETIGIDYDSDIAVLQVDLPAEQLQPVTLADSDGLFIGQSTVAIGSPFGQNWTMTTGIISALNRTIEGLDGYRIAQVIQTDAAINPGNSGGPLLNLRGEVIGVNSQIISRSRTNSGIGFAVPSNLVRRVAVALIEKGVVDYSYIGITGDDLGLVQMEALGLPNNARGVVIGSVLPGGPAERAGLRSAGQPDVVDGFSVFRNVDIIIAIDGQPISGMDALVGYLAANTAPGQTITVSVLRNGREQVELPVTLVGRPQ